MVDGQFLEALVDEIGDPLVSWTVCGEIALWNRAAERLLGYAPHEVIGRNAGVVIPAELMDEHASLHAYLAQGGTSAELDTCWRHASGERVDVSLSLSRISAPHGEMRGVACVVRPVSPTAQLIDGLRRRAHTDAVTGALNRAGIEELMVRPDHVNPAAHRAILFIDLDGFKKVNDEAGHRRGDLLLRSCAERIKTRLPAGHALARWGGDEFVVFLDGLPDHEAAAHQLVEITCNTLLFALRLSYTLGNVRYSCPASIGACVYQPHKVSAGVALEVADRAMYEVKAEGKDSCRVRGAPESTSVRRAQPRVA